jgi:hypothetical protein
MSISGRNASRKRGESFSRARACVFVPIKITFSSLFQSTTHTHLPLPSPSHPFIVRRYEADGERPSHGGVDDDVAAEGHAQHAPLGREGEAGGGGGEGVVSVVDFLRTSYGRPTTPSVLKLLVLHPPHRRCLYR